MKAKITTLLVTLLIGINCVSDKVKTDVKDQAVFQCLAAMNDATATQEQKDSICILAAAAVKAND
ncbi:hypothetical protein EHQ61_16385 [Leptospira wolffii]|uniref:hypothetical protein n=1 Tax=Leptospira wolffii TaxID=409998 RepID=UPI001083AF1F|nr:hypothetical protein [Leptospira wolffii]TGL46329.1 hypothetical protein EHQ61_16385 [Leptospira wolffii]